MPPKKRPLPASDYVDRTHYITDNAGHIQDSDTDTLRAGATGPALLEDHYMREKITHFDHERIPERVVHARGTGAHGYFECTNPAPDITSACIFQKKGERVPIFTRFSTVQGSRGSVDTPRDVRGFSTRFYTPDGHWDLVANNIPVFFIQDPIKFPDLVHALKPEPHDEIPQAASAHSSLYDYCSASPETAHMLMWLMSPRALPLRYDTMEGFGVHTFRMINAQGDSVFVKFVIKPENGLQSMPWNEAMKAQAHDNDFHRRFLYSMLNKQQTVAYRLGVQVIPDSAPELAGLGFSLLDSTKVIPEEMYPFRELGRMVLTDGPVNFFSEVEQVAFCLAHIIPGIEFSNDPLLQGRLFSYLDTQISRLGVNFMQLPINRPRCPFGNNYRDGKMRMAVDSGYAYFPNYLENNLPTQATDVINGTGSFKVIHENNNTTHANTGNSSSSSSAANTTSGNTSDRNPPSANPTDKSDSGKSKNSGKSDSQGKSGDGNPCQRALGSVCAGNTRVRVTYPVLVNGPKIRAKPRAFHNHFEQAALFWQSQSEWEKAHIVMGFSFELNEVPEMEVRQRFLDNILKNIDDDLARRVSNRIGTVYNGGGAQYEHTPCASLSYHQRLFSRQGSLAVVFIGPDTKKSTVEQIRAAVASIGMELEVCGMPTDPIPIDLPIFNVGSSFYECMIVATSNETRLAQPQVQETMMDGVNHGKTVVDASGKILSMLGKSADADQGILSGSPTDKKLWDGMVSSLTKVFRYFDRQNDTISGKMPV